MSDMKIKFSVHENPLKDEKGRTTYQVRQDTMGVATDPKEITGNDLEVTGISFKPDKELMEKAQSELVYFEHSAPRVSVGHSDDHPFWRVRKQAGAFVYFPNDSSVG